MSAETAETPTTDRARVAHVARRAVAWLLLAVALVLAGTLVLAGQRPASYVALQTAIERGEVDAVTVHGGLGEGRGSATVDLVWRDGWLWRVSTVTEATSRRDAGNSPEGPVFVGSVSDSLRELRPGLEVERDGWRPYDEVGSWRVPQRVSQLAVVLVFGVLVLLLATPRPWRATRWAWFWLVWAAFPLGLIAFLVLGGPTGLLRPARPEKRLTGGWAFLLAVGVNAVGGTVVTAIVGLP
ncbi:hypothetical protein GON03_08265 [Nocardioides sp. MAH-18]|uniref:Uncharacterized protein n=1 Tax=Nocardioides agri TaxID=2682843 RepID=A0A6L6XR01_9ACTN|nr:MULTISPECIES: hypothetical protein [unclassified Nocardioides]MBA2954312.1 hypothetical protein [Nocardioides sp. CGMCC 1.13656]MVQ49173.1 hypothetical protein [Nocardioides sp. MAH-18]